MRKKEESIRFLVDDRGGYFSVIDVCPDGQSRKRNYTSIGGKQSLVNTEDIPLSEALQELAGKIKDADKGQQTFNDKQVEEKLKLSYELDGNPQGYNPNNSIEFTCTLPRGAVDSSFLSRTSVDEDSLFKVRLLQGADRDKAKILVETKRVFARGIESSTPWSLEEEPVCNRDTYEWTAEKEVPLYKSNTLAPKFRQAHYLIFGFAKKNEERERRERDEGIFVITDIKSDDSFKYKKITPDMLETCPEEASEILRNARWASSWCKQEESNEAIYNGIERIEKGLEDTSADVFPRCNSRRDGLDDALEKVVGGKRRFREFQVGGTADRMLNISVRCDGSLSDSSEISLTVNYLGKNICQFPLTSTGALTLMEEYAKMKGKDQNFNVPRRNTLGIVDAESRNEIMIKELGRFVPNANDRQRLTEVFFGPSAFHAANRNRIYAMKATNISGCETPSEMERRMADIKSKQEERRNWSRKHKILNFLGLTKSAEALGREIGKLIGIYNKFNERIVRYEEEANKSFNSTYDKMNSDFIKPIKALMAQLAPQQGKGEGKERVREGGERVMEPARPVEPTKRPQTTTKKPEPTISRGR